MACIAGGRQVLPAQMSSRGILHKDHVDVEHIQHAGSIKRYSAQPVTLTFQEVFDGCIEAVGRAVDVALGCIVEDVGPAGAAGSDV